MNRGFSLLIGMALVLIVSYTTFAASYSSDEGLQETVSEFSKAKQRIEEKDYFGAIPILTAIINADGTNADAYNLLGFSYRNLGKHIKAREHYEKALYINPKHKGALEYYGKLHLKLGDLTGAEKLLSRLDKACLAVCREYNDLKTAIERFNSPSKP